ncbi:MAG: phage adsorption protein NrfB [Elusimicrobiaceae bacterium]|jgi:bacteriophage N4 adsorption protein B|nr:phage adsorption protein NrfB [Elusimicrobiaceae bacterium]MBT3955521.1 phage adsorption protein NrfB [Elusimicrobiaceae bacterium]MBT4008148.1 phage adsorption protein NrfB [Elusimicrobiaceae bacterium]MBT4402552.1 phage adsorption protein NrfB [Elusimicrobiaceae bacterium]MBT4439679.1 phage adsorption protein NrfB [Elusimicrobiaceae bacterium]
MFLDITIGYWIFMKSLFYFCAVVIMISSTDDFFIDLVYWLYVLPKRKFSKKFPHNTLLKDFNTKPEKQIAVMVPAWKEEAVIEKMARLTIEKIQYKNYQLFIGTYPNDKETQEKVDIVCKNHKQVHKVVNKKSGPTTKADCLNNIMEAVFAYEKKHKMKFEVIAYSDAEDIIFPIQLKLMNALCPTYGLVQLPVFSLKRKLWQITGSHYMDEFAESHLKDLPVREFLTGNVPSAGVGTAFSREAIEKLHYKNNGFVFNPTSLAEDYEIGFTLHDMGFKETICLMPTPKEYRSKNTVLDCPYIAVQEYFPSNFIRAVKQKSRWISGIVFQGTKHIGWPDEFWKTYILLRDRKSIITNPIMILAYFVALHIIAMEVHSGLGDGMYWFPNLVPLDSWLWIILIFNGFYLSNRILQRFIAVYRIYGLPHALISPIRIIWSNIVNFFAFIHAFRLIRGSDAKDENPIWDKTAHEFPDV